MNYKTTIELVIDGNIIESVPVFGKADAERTTAWLKNRYYLQSEDGGNWAIFNCGVKMRLPTKEEDERWNHHFS